MKIILFFVLLVITIVILVFLGWSFCKWSDGYESSGVRMSLESSDGFTSSRRVSGIDTMIILIAEKN